MKTLVPLEKYNNTLCCVYGCSSRLNCERRSDISFHNIPFNSSKEFMRKWINAIKLPTKITNDMLVCSRHFIPDDYRLVGETKVLMPDAIPSQNLPRVWRNKFFPRTYGRLIKLIEVRGIGRLRLCFEAKLSRRLRKADRINERDYENRKKKFMTEKKKNELVMDAFQKAIGKSLDVGENAQEVDCEGKEIEGASNIIHIVDDHSKSASPKELDSQQNVEHSLTSEIEIKEEPLSETEHEEEETVEEMLAKMNEEALDDEHVTIIENESEEFDLDDDELIWPPPPCKTCGEECTGSHEFYCGPCEKTFKTHRQLNAHNLSHFEYRRRGNFASDKEAVCKVCGAVVSTKSSLNHHMLLHSNEQKKYTCMLCDKVFRHKANLVIHINSHSLHPNHRCKLCGKTFQNKDDLDNHVQKHQVVIREYTCRGCGLHFKSRQACWAHLNSHMRAKIKCSSFMCDVCGRVLSTKATLKEHMFIHSGEKPFECQLCGKKIRHRANFIIHVQGHSLGQPHICHLCGMGFAKKMELQSHTAAEHPEDRPYLCTICGIRFRSETRFLKHAVSHDAHLEDDV